MASISTSFKHVTCSPWEYFVEYFVEYFGVLFGRERDSSTVCIPCEGAPFWQGRNLIRAEKHFIDSWGGDLLLCVYMGRKFCKVENPSFGKEAPYDQLAM
jgi:hypothetical protein